MSFTKGKDEKEPDKLVPPSFTPGSPNSTSQKAEAFLGRGSKVVGTLTFSGQVELDGYVEGEINARDSLIIGEGAVINAKVIGSEILVKGTVTGDIVASKRLSLKKPAKVVGNISSTNLSIEEGVVFEGKCTMTSSPAAQDAKGSAKPLSGDKEKMSASL